MRKFFDYIQIPNFDVAADATATFKVGCACYPFALWCEGLLITKLSSFQF